MKILVLGINYSPEIIGTAVYTSDLVEKLSDKGNDISVVTAQPYYPAWQVFKGYNKYLYSNEIVSNSITVTRCPHYVPPKPTGIRRIVHHASFAFSAMPVFLWKALIWRPSIVFVVAPSLISAPVGWLGARLSGAKCWLHIQDLEVEAAFATGLLTENSKTGRWANIFERWILSRFDKISSISTSMLQKIAQKGISEKKIFELRNWADLSRIAPMKQESKLKKELGITTEFVLLYSGNIANKQGLEIIPAAARLLTHRQDLTFAICGEGSFAEELKEMSADVASIKFFPLQPKDRLNELLAMATIHLLPQVESAADLVLPSKLTNMLASGRPVLVTACDGTALSTEIDGCGLRVEPGDTHQLAKSIEVLLENDERRKAYGRVARLRALERWDPTTILARLEIELQNMEKSDA